MTKNLSLIKKEASVKKLGLTAVPSGAGTRSMSSVRTASKSDLEIDEQEKNVTKQDAFVNSPLISWLRQEV
jgi:hypothetical protein